MSTVDVAIPCYNYAHYLEQCVASVLSQRDVSVRVLIIDDASPDNTPEVAQRLAASDPRVEYKRNETNLRLIAVSNLGMLEWAQAPYSLLLSADDALTPGALARAVEALEKTPDAGLAYGLAIASSATETPPPPSDTAAPDVKVMPGTDFLRFCCEVGNPVPSPAAVVRTAMQRRIGGYLAEFPYTSDLEMWLRFAMNGPVIAIDAFQAYYRVHGSNAYISQWKDRPFGDRPLVIDTFDYAMEHGGGEIDAFVQAYTAMKEKWADETNWLAGEAYARGDLALHRQCMSFAAQLSPRYSTSGVSMRHRLKKLLGVPKGEPTPGEPVAPATLGRLPEPLAAAAQTG